MNSIISVIFSGIITPEELLAEVHKDIKVIKEAEIKLHLSQRTSPQINQAGLIGEKEIAEGKYRP